MKQSAFPNATHFRDRHQKLRWRYRKDGLTVSLGTDYGSKGFILRYNAAVKGERLQVGKSSSPHLAASVPGSLTNVIDHWYASGEFKRLGAPTQRMYRYISERLRTDHGTKRVVTIGRKDIKAFMAAKADTPSSANNDLRVWRFVLDHALESGLIEVNPAREIKKYSTANEGFHTWTEEEITAFYKHHAEGTTAHLCMTLMLHTAASRSDAIALGPANLKHNRLRYSRQKMKTRDGIVVDIPLHPYLKQVLDALPEGQTTFLQVSSGRARTANGPGTYMR